MTKEYVSLIILNDKNEILLQLRDNIQSIPFPNTWCNLGGGIEENEKPDEAIKREISEEIGLDIENFKFFRKYISNQRIDWVFSTSLSLDLEKVILSEGQKIEYFSFDDAIKLTYGFGEEKFVVDFFNNIA